MEYNEAVEFMFNKLQPSKIMALASSVDDHVMVRNISALIYNDRIYFKTDKNFFKTQQLFKNNRVALCFSGIQVEGIAHNKGLVIDEPDRTFEKAYEKYLWGSYNAYSHEEDEIFFEVEPTFAELWDTDDKNHAFQIFIDFENKTVKHKKYD